MKLCPSAFLLKDFGMHTPSQLRFMKRTLKLWSDQNSWKFNAAQQLTVTLIPSMVIMMSTDDRCFVVDEWVIVAVTAPMHSITAVMDSSTLHRTAPTRFICQEHHASKTGLIQSNNMPTPEWTDHTPPTMDTDMGNISTDHNQAAIPTATGTAAVSEGTHHTPHPLWFMLPFDWWAPPLPLMPWHTQQEGSHPIPPSPLPLLMSLTPYSMDQSQSCYSNSHCPMQKIQLMRKTKPCPRPSTPHKSHCAKTVIIQDSPSDSDNDSTTRALSQ